jgi:hypothetical protein
VTCADGDITEMNFARNTLTGTIPSSLGSLTKLSSMDLHLNNLEGTIPSSLASMTKLTQIDLFDNALTGLVPALPFKQYSGDYGCFLDNPTGSGPNPCTEPNCNHFKCPLPAGSEQCKAYGSTGVHCK